MHQATGIPQDIVDRAAALSAKPNATSDLQDLMDKLSGISNDVEGCLKEIDILLKVSYSIIISSFLNGCVGLNIF